MRGIPTSAYLVILLIFIGIELISFIGLLKSLKHSGKRMKITFSAVYWLISAYILATFSYVFSGHDRLRLSTDYSFFNFVLIVFFFNLVSKSALSLFSIISGIVYLVSRQISRIVYSAGLIVIIGIMLAMAFSVLFDKKNLRTEEVPVFVESLPESLDGFTIAQLSDVHLGSLNHSKTIVKQAKRIIAEQKPDLILFTGDMVNNFSFETDEYIELFREMKAPYGKYAITGNHDYGDYYHWKTEKERDENLEKIRKSIREMGFDLLLNENRRIQVKDTAMYVIGVENWGHDPFPQYADLKKATKDVPNNVFSILMSHDPAHWDAQIVPQTEIPLTLSGHTHGLQFGIRIAGIEFSPMYFIQKYWGGLYRKGNQQLYVNRGMGTIGFAGRVEMRPEITLLTLHRN